MKRFLILAAALVLSFEAGAEVVLPDILASNMVLQQQTGVKLWGSARPNAEVTVRASWGASASARSDADGRWETTLQTPAASHTPCTLSFSDGSGRETVVDNVLIGEVWLCSGQSNMEMPLDGFWNCPVEDADETIMTSGSRKSVRVATVDKIGAFKPQETTRVQWNVSSPDAAGRFSAAAFHFACRLNEVLDVPVGVVVCAWGGSRVEGWLPEETVARYDDIDLAKEFRQYEDGGWNWLTPVTMYNGMLYPLRRFAVRGFLWYQGESNVGRHEAYVERLQTMARQWRSDWECDELPFYIVELAPCIYGGDGTSCARFREAQHHIARVLPHSGIVTTNDLAYPYEENQIHPCRKREVGQRLAHLALNRTYGVQGAVCDGAVYREMRTEGDSIRLMFDNATDGFSPWSGIEGFEVAGEDRVFYPAEAVVDTGSRTIVVRSDKVAHPVAARYCFRDFQPGNLTGRRGLPVAPFRTDDWGW